MVIEIKSVIKHENIPQFHRNVRTVLCEGSAVLQQGYDKFGKLGKIKTP
jgi:hypothetical protein